MKTKYSFLLVAALALGASVTLAQEDRKPAPPDSPPAADGANPPTAATPNPTATPPGSDSRHGEHHRDGGSRTPEAGRYGEGWHHSGSWPPEQPPIPTKPTSYIGVMTVPPPAVLSAQLGLADGFGLVVLDVLPDSPAAKAGVQRYDVLTKFNEQDLVDSGQFSTLVRAVKKDTETTVVLIRKAQEQKVTVKIEERLLPERRPYPMPSGDYRHTQGMNEYDRRMPMQRSPSPETSQPSELPPPGSAPPISPEDMLREVRPGGAAQIRIFNPDGNVTYNMANAKLMMKDDGGEIELTSHDGKRSLVARNAQGETIFDGPIDTEEQRKALPEDLRKKIESIEVQRKLAEARGLPPGRPGPGLEPEVQ